MATPMAAPTTGDEADSTSQYGARKLSQEICASCDRISPMMSEANRPSPMADSASMM